MQPVLSADVSNIEYVRHRSIPVHFIVTSLISIGLSFQWYMSLSASSTIVVIIALILILLSHLFTIWFIQFDLMCNYNRVKKVDEADSVLVHPIDSSDPIELCPITRSNNLTFFIYHKLKYTLQCGEFRPVQYPDTMTGQQYLNASSLNIQELESKRQIYGPNQMDVEIPTFLTLLRERAQAPLFVFQIFCVILSCLNDYWYYGLLTLSLLIVFESILVVEQKRNMSQIRSMGNKPFILLVYRDRKWRKVSSLELVPGDICLISRSMVLPCDVVLLAGSCIVDESLLTGESAPVIKEPVDLCTKALENDTTDLQAEHKLHILHGGSTVVQISSGASNLKNITVKGSFGSSSCLCYVTRTGFASSQGQLLKTMLYNFNRPSANNLETFMFICFLLIFALIAAFYVWEKGCEIIEKTSRYKLILECVMIITDVIPPELSVELSNAVNSSLTSLYRIGIFCTEPYRIPFAGKLDICCFDKTGTLTADKIIVEGIVDDVNLFMESNEIKPISECDNAQSIAVLACCHSLVNLQSSDALVGDPFEKTALESIGWHLMRDDVVTDRSTKYGSAKKWRIELRYHFSSKLRRMCVVGSNRGLTESTGKINDVVYFCAAKGAPEVLREMYTHVPEGYDETVNILTRRGRRLLALGYKPLPEIRSPMDLYKLSRLELEKELEFGGLVVITCPLKPESINIIADLRHSSLHIKMVTGDNAMTACHVARQLSINQHENCIICDGFKDGLLLVRCIETGEQFEIAETSVLSSLHELCSRFDFCLTGDIIDAIGTDSPIVEPLLACCSVFARFSPQQKGKLINDLKQQGFYTLMCGDGTNDVGALKNAHVGVAIFPESEYGTYEKLYGDVSLDVSQIVQLGDASIAAPFTSRQSSIEAVCQIVKQGRCTLVTTLQIFKILALNALILAYGRSVLYIQGVKFSDAQATLQGAFIAVCFFGVSRSRPLDRLSKQRPIPDIFNLYTISTVLLQSIVHLFTLIRLNKAAQKFVVHRTDILIDLDAKFYPNMVNSVVYAAIMLLQTINFAVNHHGHPFMQSLHENKILRTSLIGSATIVLMMVSGTIPDLSRYFQVDLFPQHLLTRFVSALALDAALCFSLDRVCDWLLSRLNRTMKKLI